MATPIPENRARFTAAEIAFATGGVLVGAAELVITGVSTDTRAVKPGNLFVAIKGESFDGHRFLAQARDAGAALVMVAHGAEVPSGVVAIAVEDTTVALGALARFHRVRWGGVVVGITGSAGKTTTKELTAACLAAGLGDEAVHATRGNLNNRVGVPMTIFGLSEGHRVAVIEMGTSIRGEIAALCAIALPDIGVLVSVGIAHAEGLSVGRTSGRQAVAEEKGALVAAASFAAVVNADDVWAMATLAGAAPRTKRIGFGRSAGASYRLTDITFDAHGTNVTIQRENQEISFAVPLLGEIVALDVAGALAAADAALDRLGLLPVRDLDATLARRVRAVPGRLALRTRADGAWVLDDTYNASPDAFRASITVARTIADKSKRRLVIVAGEMRELGSFAEQAHDEVSRAIAEARPAILVGCGGLADRYGGEKAADARAAAAVISERIQPSDLVLVKASRGVGAEVVVDAILARGGEVGQQSGGGGVR
ncbi:MAG: UDP-N-acetylmuramoyl-tripeptide--D-alanyl-D-alanine ligase [Polyangiales bacterium]